MRYLFKKERGRFFIEKYTDPDLDKDEKYKQECIGFPITKPAPSRVRNFELFTSLIQELKEQAVRDGWVNPLDLLIVSEEKYLDTPTEQALHNHEQRLSRIETAQIELFDTITHKLIPEIKKVLAEKANAIWQDERERRQKQKYRKKFVRDPNDPLDELFIDGIDKT